MVSVTNSHKHISELCVQIPISKLYFSIFISAGTSSLRPHGTGNPTTPTLLYSNPCIRHRELIPVTSVNRSTTTRIASGTETLTSLGVPWYAGPCGAFNTYRFWVFALRAGAPIIAPPTNFFANGTSLPRPSLRVLAELASSSLACTMITTTYNHTSGGAGCSDPLAATCTPSASTSSACLSAVTAVNVWSLPAYFHTMRINVPYQRVMLYKDALLDKTQQELAVSRKRLVFANATTFSATLTMVTLVIIERPPGSTEPDAATAAERFLKSASGEAPPDVKMLLSPGATALLDTNFQVQTVMRHACIDQIPQPFVDNGALCSAPSYVAPAPPAPAPLAPGAAAGVTVSFKLSGVDITTFSRATFAVAVARTLGLASTAALSVDVRAGSVVVSVLLPYAAFGSAQTAGAAAAVLVAQASNPNSGIDCSATGQMFSVVIHSHGIFMIATSQIIVFQMQQCRRLHSAS
jgi:hypothetical protein